jgi:hypothetical protein
MADADLGETVRAWRATGAHRADPVRFRFLEALAQRAEGQQGAVRRLLDERLAALVASYGELLAARTLSPRAAVNVIAPRRSALADLLRHIAAAHPANAPSAAVVAQPQDLKTVREFRGTWSRLSAQQRLKQSLSKVPDNAGPLNSLQLVHRALLTMHELSPAYLDRFLAQVEALLWLEQQAQARPLSERKEPPPRGMRKA